MFKLGKHESLVVYFVYLFFLIKLKNDKFSENRSNIFRISRENDFLIAHLKWMTHDKHEKIRDALTMVAEILLTLLRA